jgi:hypothetical protein
MNGIAAGRPSPTIYLEGDEVAAYGIDWDNSDVGHEMAATCTLRVASKSEDSWEGNRKSRSMRLELKGMKVDPPPEKPVKPLTFKGMGKGA